MHANILRLSDPSRLSRITLSLPRVMIRLYCCAAIQVIARKVVCEETHVWGADVEV